MNLFSRLFSGNRRPRSLDRESAARARRARDHLEKKRDRERVRLSRERAKHEISAGRKRTLRILTPGLAIAAAVLGYQLATPIAESLWLDDAPLTHLAIQGHDALSSAQIAAQAGALAGLPLDTIEPAGFEADLAQSPWIDSARVLRLPTGTLVVRVAERGAIARWKGPEAEPEVNSEWIDASGTRFAASDAPLQELPSVQGTDLLASELPADALLILDALTQHDALSRDPSRITLHLPGLEADEDGVLRVSPAGFVLEVGDGGPRALLGRRLLTQRVARLASLLDEAEETLARARLIDLRYADRAVVRTESASG